MKPSCLILTILGLLLTAYPSGDDHPNRAGNAKATGEFVQMLNVFYYRWAGQ